MSKHNQVLEGKGKGQKITLGSGVIYIGDNIILSKRQVHLYQLIDETNKSQYSFFKGLAGAALFGGIGAIAGIGGKKTKEYLVVVNWKDGKQSLLSLNEEGYKALVASMF